MNRLITATACMAACFNIFAATSPGDSDAAADATAWASSGERRDPRADSGGRWVPGPLALSQMRAGVREAEAISNARAAGEYAQYLPSDPRRARSLIQVRALTVRPVLAAAPDSNRELR